MPYDYSEYEKQIHRLGRTMQIVGLTMLFLVPFVFSWILDASINWKGYLSGIMKIFPIYIPSSLVEYIIYVPILGAGGSYLAFMTGNITNMKLPCAISAKEIAQTEAGTAENNIVSTLSIATSSLVTMLVIFIGVLSLIPLTPILENPTLAPAFENILPALFGALGVQYFVKSWKLTIVPLLLTVVLCLIVPALIAQTTYMMIISGAIAIGLAFIFYKKGWL